MYFHCPKVVRQIANCYKDLGLQYHALCAYIALCLFGVPNLKAFTQQNLWAMSHSSLSRSFNQFDEHKLNRMRRRMLESVLKHIKNTGGKDRWILAIDTTDNPTRMKRASHAGYFAKSDNSLFIGQNLLVLAAVDTKTGHAYPLLWKPLEKGEGAKKGWELCLTLLSEIVSYSYPKLPVVLDSWFDGVNFMNSLEEQGWVYSIQLKSSRLCAPVGRKKEGKWKKLKKVFHPGRIKRYSLKVTRDKARNKIDSQKGKFYSIVTADLRSSDRKATVRNKITAVFNTICADKAFAYYVTNELSGPDDWSWQMSRWRWNIEVLFRDLKQKMGWTQYSFQKEKAMNAMIFMAFLVTNYFRVRQKNSDSLGAILSEIVEGERYRNLILLYERGLNRCYTSVIKKKIDEIFIKQTDAAERFTA